MPFGAYMIAHVRNDSSVSVCVSRYEYIAYTTVILKLFGSDGLSHLWAPSCLRYVCVCHTWNESSRRALNYVSLQNSGRARAKDLLSVAHPLVVATFIRLGEAHGVVMSFHSQSVVGIVRQEQRIRKTAEDAET